MNQDLSAVTAAILAGGLGTRLRAAVADRPKVLALVHGRPFLSYLLDQLVEAGVKDVVLCTGYLGHQLEAEFGSAYRTVRLSYSQEPASLGTAGALRLALPLFSSDTVLVLNGDSFCQADLKAFYHWHCTQKAAATLNLAHVPDTSRYGSVQVGPEGRILSFQEKREKGGPGWISAGIYLLDRNLISAIPAGRAVSIEQEIFPSWLGQGLYGYKNEAPFLDIGTPASYEQASQFFSEL